MCILLPCALRSSSPISFFCLTIQLHDQSAFIRRSDFFHNHFPFIGLSTQKAVIPIFNKSFFHFSGKTSFYCNTEIWSRFFWPFMKNKKKPELFSEHRQLKSVSGKITPAIWYLDAIRIRCSVDYFSFAIYSFGIWSRKSSTSMDTFIFFPFATNRAVPSSHFSRRQKSFFTFPRLFGSRISLIFGITSLPSSHIHFHFHLCAIYFHIASWQKVKLILLYV